MQLKRTLALVTYMIGSSLHAVTVINNSNMLISVTDFIFCALYEGAYIGELRIDPNDSYEIENIAGCIVAHKNSSIVLCKNRKMAFIKLQNYHTITITDTQNIILSEMPREKPEYCAQEVSISEFKKYAKKFPDAVLDSF